MNAATFIIGFTIGVASCIFVGFTIMAAHFYRKIMSEKEQVYGQDGKTSGPEDSSGDSQHRVLAGVPD